MILENTPEFWRSVQEDSTITLTDQITIEMSSQAGLGMVGQSYNIDSVTSVYSSSIHSTQWILFEMSNADQRLYLLVKIVNDKYIDLRVLAEVESVCGDRRKCCCMVPWIFDLVDGQYLEEIEEDVLDKMPVCELKYAKSFELEMILDDKREVYCEFDQKNQGEMHCNVEGDSEQIATIVEYQCGEDVCPEPECLLIEIGHHTNVDGGMVRLLTGNSISAAEIDVL